MMLKKIKIFAFGLLLLAGSITSLEAQQRRGTPTSQTRRTDVVLRCAYWKGTKATEETKLFIKEGREYTPFVISEMAFINAYEYSGPVPIPIFRKATPAEAERLREEGHKRADCEYIQHALIDTKGLRDIGVILQGDIKNNQSIVIDLNEKNFAPGAIRVVNASGLNLAGRFGPPNDANAELFQIPQAMSSFYTTKGVKERTIKDLMLAVVDPKLKGGSQIVFASSAAFRPESRSIIFVARSQKPSKPGKAPRVEVYQISVLPLPPKADDKAEPENNRGNNPRNNRNKKPTREKEKRPVIRV